MASGVTLASPVISGTTPLPSSKQGASLSSTTDATLAHQNLVLLEDDKNVQPSQNLVPAVGSDFLKANPEVATVSPSGLAEAALAPAFSSSRISSVFDASAASSMALTP